MQSGPFRSHPTAQACGAGTPVWNGPEIAVEGLMQSHHLLLIQSTRIAGTPT